VSIQPLARLKKNILVCRFKDDLPVESGKKIDVWWGGRENNGDLMLLLAYLIRLNRGWDEADITIRSVVENKKEQEALGQGIRQILPRARVQAKVEILLQGTQSFQSILEEYSGDSDMVLLGLGQVDKDQEEKAAKQIDDLTRKLKASILVQNNGMPNTVPILLKLKNE